MNIKRVRAVIRVLPVHPIHLAAALVLAAALAWSADRFDGSTQEQNSQHLAVCFSPEGHCTDAIIEAIGNAKSTVLVQAADFTSRPIADALAQASKRGTTVAVIMDGRKLVENQKVITILEAGAVSVLADSAHATAHNKVIVLDDREVVTGSFNFTYFANSNNAENVLFVNDAAVAAEYTKNWREHESHSQKLDEVAS